MISRNATAHQQPRRQALSDRVVSCRPLFREHSHRCYSPASRRCPRHILQKDKAAVIRGGHCGFVRICNTSCSVYLHDEKYDGRVANRVTFCWLYRYNKQHIIQTLEISACSFISLTQNHARHDTFGISVFISHVYPWHCDQRSVVAME